ncbi:MAG: hypothetical protein AMXMBFR56_71410 [Polyangiaceae bacterium]
MRKPFTALCCAALTGACMEGLPPDLPPRKPIVARPLASAAEPEAQPPPEQPSAPVLVPQTGHVSQVWSVAFHPSGRFLATGGFDHTVGIWNLEGGLLAQLTGHHEALKRVAWSGDGRVLASIARDSRIIVWDLARFAAKRVIEHPGFDLALGADGKRIYTVGPQAELSVYDAETGKLLDSARTPNGEGRQLLGVALSADGRFVATASLDGLVHVWDTSKLAARAKLAARTWRLAFGSGGRLAVPSGDRVLIADAETGKVERELATGNGVSHVAFGQDGRRLFASVGNDVMVFDPESGKRLAKYSAGIIEALGVSRDGSLVATGNDDPQVRLWRAESGAPVRALGSPWGEVSAARFDPKGERIATAAALWIDVWDAQRGKILRRLRAKKKQPGAPAWSPDGALVAASVADGSVGVWDAESGAELGQITVPTRDDWGPRFAFSPDSKALAMFAGDRLSIWDRGKRKIVKSIALKLSLASDLVWNGSVVAVGGGEGVELFDSSAWKPLGRLDVKQLVAWGRVEDLELSADGKSLVVATSQHIGRWDVGSRTLVAKIEGRSLHAAPVFSPDGRLIAFPDRKRAITLWDGRTTFEVLRADSAVRQIRFSPDGKRLAVATDDSLIRVVDVASRKLLRTLAGHEARIWSLTWHPSGEVLLSASHQARLHRVSDGKLLTLRARYDAPKGVVHSADAFSGEASELLRLRSGASLEQATLSAVSSGEEGLLGSFWQP